MKSNYCPNCGKSTLKQVDKTKYSCSNCGYEYWNNPKATVAIIMIRDDKILFSKRRIEPRKGKYDFPGGFIEYNESAYEAGKRELEEETGLKIDASKLKLFETYHAEYIPGTSVVDLVFVLQDFEGTPVAADDSESLEWKPLDFLDSNQFIEYYPGVRTKLEAFLENN